MGNMEIYNALKTPPQDALNTISFGALKGKSDISPQWRYEALTEQFGPCGTGWAFTVNKWWTQPVEATGEIMVYVEISLFIRDGEKWGAAIPGWGGDFLIKKDKNGIRGNDEAMKMAVTDALGTAAKMIGVAADVYRGKMNGKSDSKYSRRDEIQREYELKNQKHLDETECWRIIDSDNVQIKANDGRFYDIKRLSLNQLKVAYTKPEFEGVREFIDKRIAELVNG